MLKSIVVTVDRFEGDFAVLRHKDHEMLWPTEDLPTDTTEGSVVTLTAMNEKQVEESRTVTAKLLLNDILNDTLGSPGTMPTTKEEHETLEEERLEQINKSIEELNDTIRKENS